MVLILIRYARWGFGAASDGVPAAGFLSLKSGFVGKSFQCKRCEHGARIFCIYFSFPFNAKDASTVLASFAFKGFFKNTKLDCGDRNPAAGTQISDPAGFAFLLLELTRRETAREFNFRGTGRLVSIGVFRQVRSGVLPAKARGV